MKAEIVSEFWLFLKARKRYWMIPILVVLALFGFVLILAETSAVAPFIYTLF